MSVYHGARSMEQSADIGESLVVLDKERDEEREMEVKMDQQQEEETAPTTSPVTVAAAAGVDRTPVHVRNHPDRNSDITEEHTVAQINIHDTSR